MVGWFPPHEAALVVEMDAYIVCCMLVSFFALRTTKPLNDELCCFGSMLKQLNHVYYKFKVHMKLLERCNISYYRFAWHRIEIEFG